MKKCNHKLEQVVLGDVIICKTCDRVSFAGSRFAKVSTAKHWSYKAKDGQITQVRIDIWDSKEKIYK